MASNKTVDYIDFGITSAKQFWEEVALPAYDKFQNQPTPPNAINVSLHAWHVHEWIWHEHHPGINTRSNPEYKQFLQKITQECHELTWIRDVADAGKHRGLGRPADAKKMESERYIFRGAVGDHAIGTLPVGGSEVMSLPICIVLTDGIRYDFPTIIKIAISYWKKEYFS
jgi:hypothetical protein